MINLKFRIWFDDVQKMRHFPNTVLSFNQRSWGLWSKVEEGNIYLEKNRVMQFTGMYDILGREIYDGDVIEGEDARGNYSRFLVVFKDGAFMAHVSDSGKPMSWLVPLSAVCKEVGGRAVIGNIFQNPELNLWGSKVLDRF